ncbi:hypothetical protein IFM89_038106 [Coptis chinensis]|uniref:Uncharacterized protein n=1 Tax=Coptis chinensis TaxID=261450 RepID=A0A835HBG8_9MAGN|nr:hypothetical protein IFM89_038106 [Coptis chinensis]
MNIASLPKSICNLRNLQILVLSYNFKLTTLPPSIGNLKQLRDAYKANLRSKRSLLKLHLRWPVGGSDVEIECNNSKEVLEALQPQPNIEHLRIHGYPGVMLPGWVGSSTALPKLTRLGLYNMPNVEGWSSECLLLPSCLQSLALYNCPKLILPTPLPSSITRLSVGKGNDPSLESVENLHNLSYLRITGFDEVETLPEAPLRNLTRLQVLEIYDCDQLKRLPTELENLSTVTILSIWNCGGLESLTEGLRKLTSLKELVVKDCWSLKSLSESSLQHLTSLQTLKLCSCPELEVMSVDFQHLISLEYIQLVWLSQLTSLPEDIQHSYIEDARTGTGFPTFELRIMLNSLMQQVADDYGLEVSVGLPQAAGHAIAVASKSNEKVDEDDLSRRLAELKARG